MTKILIVSDAWRPQINGVVRTLEATVVQLRAQGHDVHIHGPDHNLWNSFAAPSYPSIKIELFGRARLSRVLDNFQPEFIHIATEGPLGWVARNLCLSRRLPFTTSYHTRFPEYLAARVPQGMRRMTEVFAYALLRRFHAPSSAIMAATVSLKHELETRRFRHVVLWPRGVDTDLFRPYEKTVEAYAALPRPILLNVGRVAIEKNLQAFLDAAVPGSKVVIGDGPDLARLKAQYPQAHFLGAMENLELARHYAAADVFVFPSKTDTFGLVLLEACACGLRIASYPAPGPVDVLKPELRGAFAALNENLEVAITQALVLPDNPSAPRVFAETFSWQACTEAFYAHLQAPTPQAIKRITRFRHWLGHWWRRAIAPMLRRWRALG